MELTKAINERRSVRGYKQEPVSKETLEKVLKLAARAVSAENTQPWEIAVISGDVLKKIAKMNVDSYLNEEEPDYDEAPFEGVYRQRKIDIAKKLFGAMDIAREDKEKRRWWTSRGFAFFDAPAAFIIYMDKNLRELSKFDIGCFTQNVCLAAMEYGLETCVEIQAVMYQEGLRKYLDVPENKTFVMGIAIGYPDEDFPANKVRSDRAELDQIVSWYGFD